MLALLALVACAPPRPQAVHTAPTATRSLVIAPTSTRPPPPPTLAPTPTAYVRPAPPTALAATVPVPTPTPPPLGSLLSGVLPGEDADYGLVVEDTTSGARVAINDHRVFPSASLYKLALAWEVLRQVDAGALDLATPLPIIDDDAAEPEPSGGLGPGDAPSLHDALAAMLTVSSNAAGHALLRLLGRHEFNAAMQEHGLGDTRVPDDATADDADNQAQAVTSAADMARLLSLIAHNQTLSESGRAELLALMASGGPPDALRETLPETVDVYDKTGNLVDASNVGALVQSGRGMVVIVVLDQGVTPADARAVIGQLGQAVYDTLLR